MTVWRWCKCLACSFKGELMQFCATPGELRCPKCNSVRAVPEAKADYEARVEENRAKYMTMGDRTPRATHKGTKT